MRILLVEDTVDVGEAVAARLERMGHAVDWQRTGPDAEAALGVQARYATAGVIITPDIPATTHVEPGTEHGFLLVSPERAYKANQPLAERTYRSVATIA